MARMTRTVQHFNGTTWLLIALAGLLTILVMASGALFATGTIAFGGGTQQVSVQSAPPAGGPAAQAVQPPPATAQQAVETRGSSPNSLPTTMGELRSMGVKHNSIDPMEIRWGWGEFQLDVVVRNNVTRWEFVSTNDNTVAARLLGSTLSKITIIAEKPTYADNRMFVDGKRVSPETIQAAMYIAERIFLIEPKTSHFGTYYLLHPKKISSARVELDKIHDISDQGLRFSSVITIVVEGEKSLRFRTEERFPSDDIDPRFRILE